MINSCLFSKHKRLLTQKARKKLRAFFEGIFCFLLLPTGGFF